MHYNETANFCITREEKQISVGNNYKYCAKKLQHIFIANRLILNHENYTSYGDIREET